LSKAKNYLVRFGFFPFLARIFLYGPRWYFVLFPPLPLDSEIWWYNSRKFKLSRNCLQMITITAHNDSLSSSNMTMSPVTQRIKRICYSTTFTWSKNVLTCLIYITAVTPFWGIHITTRVFPSLRRSGMHTTCVAFCLRRLCLRNSKYGRYLLKPILVIVLNFFFNTWRSL